MTVFFSTTPNPSFQKEGTRWVLVVVRADDLPQPLRRRVAKGSAPTVGGVLNHSQPFSTILNPSEPF